MSNQNTLWRENIHSYALRISQKLGLATENPDHFN